MDLLMHSIHTPTCFSKLLPSSGGRRYLKSYSSNICIVGVYGLRSVQCDQLWRDKMTNKYVQEVMDLLMHSRYTPTCFSKLLPSSGGRRSLRSYSSDICIVGVYGLRSVQWFQLYRDATHPYTTGNTGRILIHVHPQYGYCLSSIWGTYDPLMMAITCWNILTDSIPLCYN
jgi:hypothetical protein